MSEILGGYHRQAAIACASSRPRPAPNRRRRLQHEAICITRKAERKWPSEMERASNSLSTLLLFRQCIVLGKGGRRIQRCKNSVVHRPMDRTRATIGKKEARRVETGGGTKIIMDVIYGISILARWQYLCDSFLLERN